MGRNTKFNTLLNVKIAALYGSGKTDKQVAEFLGVSLRTIYYWKASQPDFLRSLKEGKDVADELVISSLFRRATGYSHPDEKIFIHEGMVIRAKTQKHYPPDVTAAIFWLKNRRPEEWRDREIEIVSTPQLDSRPQKLSFEQYCVNAGYPKPYPKQIEMKSFWSDGDEPRLLLGARGYGKTDYMTVLGTGYDVYSDWFDHTYFGSDLTETNLIISKSKARNTAIIQEIANSLKANGVELDKENSTCLRVKGLVGKDHSVEVLTIKSSFRGRHPKRITMDDPVTEEDTSEAMRTLVKKKYDEAYKLCKNIVIIGQPAHQFDLYAELRGNLKKLEVPWGSIAELDADLEAMKSAGVDSNSIEMSYHLRVPIDGSMAFSKIRYLDKFPIGESVAFLDPSEGGDYTAISILKGYMDGVAVQGHAWKKAWYHCLDELVPILRARKVTRLCFETNKFGQQPIAQLSQALHPFGIGVVGRHSDSDKHASIMSAGSYAHMIHLSKESDKVYTDQVVKYEYGAKFDDSPDSLARCLEWIGLLKGKR
jgi:hypothetical protein